MLPMTAATKKPQETINEMMSRIDTTNLMTREDANRILASCVDVSFYTRWFSYVNQAVAIKLGSL